jgi:hypothetical protein
LTYYAYTNPYNASRPTAVAYPDMAPAMVSVDPNTLVVTLSGSDYVSTAFDLAGRPVSRTDQRGTTHSYSYFRGQFTDFGVASRSSYAPTVMDQRLWVRHSLGLAVR